MAPIMAHLHACHNLGDAFATTPPPQRPCKGRAGEGLAHPCYLAVSQLDPQISQIRLFPLWTGAAQAEVVQEGLLAEAA
jgi:hypothetical protein